MGRMKRVNVSLSPAMEIAIGYLAQQEEAAEGTVARRLLRSSLDRTIHSAAVQELIAQRRSGMNRKEWAAFQEEAAEELRRDEPTGSN